jgi:hypothetical protein
MSEDQRLYNQRIIECLRGHRGGRVQFVKLGGRYVPER